METSITQAQHVTISVPRFKDDWIETRHFLFVYSTLCTPQAHYTFSKKNVGCPGTAPSALCGNSLLSSPA